MMRTAIRFMVVLGTWAVLLIFWCLLVVLGLVMAAGVFYWMAA